MERNVGDTLLYEGVVSNISFTMNKEKALVEFEDSDFIFEFRNGKKKRADTVKMMKLQAGERIIAVGAKSSGNQKYVYGWDVKREGTVNAGRYFIMKGEVTKTVKVSPFTVAYVRQDDKIIPLKISEPVYAGKKLAALCYFDPCSECSRPCPDWKPEKCCNCKRRKSARHFTALEIRNIS